MYMPAVYSGPLPVCCVCGEQKCRSHQARKCNACLAAAERFRQRVRRLAEIPITHRRIVEARDGSTCRYCGRTCEPGRDPRYWERSRGEIDHVVSARAGGWGRAPNLVVACAGCNRKKAARQAFTFRVISAFFATENDASVRLAWGAIAP
jgi:5-methylcytosine-specific restriction endonuclease McrA